MSRRAYSFGEQVQIGEMPVCLYEHLTPEEYRFHCVNQRLWEVDEATPAKVYHHWYRFVPAQPGDEYRMWAFPAKPHTRGAFPVTSTE